MNELFKDIVIPQTKKRHFIEVDGKNIEVSLQKKVEILNNGIGNYILENNEVVLKPKVKTQRTYSELRKDSKGYVFLDHDPYWPADIIEGGYTWQTPSE